ncbi:hypothetical protein A2Y83_02665 [Candidatus Falkowbacteria bacterium RBG_13_39_14]|uniref:Radical SAM core domain-containing protein n=1 Tax=Candidatus Falkowbacteria bacterium RBG_13_39_14 TaxID=1797985 RepID=A0A1F5S399_9BACT|nr:MAG: hypothetical protein A2Y83_02665 [Candidatus Falkowbacteria bacterium RBG_13_39_14]
MIKDITLAITYKCNARCRICNIWQKKAPDEIDPGILNLPCGVKDINITGGEPFLHPSLIEIIGRLKEKTPKANIVISTNGFAADLILKKVEEILKIDPNIGIAVSLDGAGNVHDNTRGVPGGFKKAAKTIEKLQSMKLKNLKIAFTIGDHNINELKKIYSFAEKIGAEFTLAALHSSKTYFEKENHIQNIASIAEELDWLMAQELKSWNYKKWGRAYFAYGLKKFLTEQKRMLPDYSGKMSIFIAPNGNIYPNNISSECMGSVADLAGNLKIAENLEENWMMCTARQAIKKHRIRVGLWIVWNKIYPQIYKSLHK